MSSSDSSWSGFGYGLGFGFRLGLRFGFGLGFGFGVGFGSGLAPPSRRADRSSLSLSCSTSCRPSCSTSCRTSSCPCPSPCPLVREAGRGVGVGAEQMGAEQMSATWVRSRCQRVACSVWGGLGTQLGRSQGDISCLTSPPCTARVTTNADADQEQGAARCSGADDDCGLLGAHAGHLVATARCWRGWRGCLEVNGVKHRQL